MNTKVAIELAYLLAVALFIIGLKMLSSPRTARNGNLLASAAMLVAVVATLCAAEILSYTMIVVGLVVGSFLGVVAATRVQMTEMPQMVALLNGFGGLASVFVAAGEVVFMALRAAEPAAGEVVSEAVEAVAAAVQGDAVDTIHHLTVGLSILIGAVTFSGSVVAFAKLQELMPSKPITFPLQNAANAAVFLAILGLMWVYVGGGTAWWLVLLALVALVLGVTLVIPIGGADMPVVISLLNSYSGLAACATGFVLRNELLIIAGALVGASGLILTKIMCVAMNRSLANVLFAAFGAEAAAGPDGAAWKKRTVRNYTIEDATLVLDSASSVIIVPGYGMAVAQAQHIVREFDDLMERKGASVKYAIHPVAGRMPGHMNVLLAESNVSYDKLVEMDDINPEFERTDVVLIIGANDVVNPAAKHDPKSPIYGMPILDVDKARTVMIVKRSLSPGFAGIDNELFYEDKTMMLFGDAKDVVTKLVAEMKKYSA